MGECNATMLTVHRAVLLHRVLQVWHSPCCCWTIRMHVRKADALQGHRDAAIQASPRMGSLSGWRDLFAVHFHGLRGAQGLGHVGHEFADNICQWLQQCSLSNASGLPLKLAPASPASIMLPLRTQPKSMLVLVQAAAMPHLPPRRNLSHISTPHESSGRKCYILHDTSSTALPQIPK